MSLRHLVLPMWTPSQHFSPRPVQRASLRPLNRYRLERGTALCRRVGVAIDAPDEEIASAANRAGISGDLVTTVLATPHTAGDLVAVGRASAELATPDGLATPAGS